MRTSLSDLEEYANRRLATSPLHVSINNKKIISEIGIFSEKFKDTQLIKTEIFEKPINVVDNSIIDENASFKSITNT